MVVGRPKYFLFMSLHEFNSLCHGSCNIHELFTIGNTTTTTTKLVLVRENSPQVTNPTRNPQS